jgi:nicotinamide phosphoribosyltransferase
LNIFAPFNSDGYKLGHAAMYADGTETVYSNLTPRSDRIYRQKATRYYDGKLVVIGMQGAIMEIVENWQKFFDMDKGLAIARFKLLCDFYLGSDSVSTDGLSKLHDLGYLPLEIKTIEEGRKVPMGIPVLTIRNTVPHAYWLVNFLETTLSDLTWKSMTNATIAGEYKAMLLDFAKRTGSPVEGVAFQAHDFSARGMSGPEDAARSGFGHIAHFLGTDTLGSVLYAMEYYGAKDFVAASVPATEHAVATSNILKIEQDINVNPCGEDLRLIAERMFLQDLITRKFPKGIVSYVADSFDFWAVLTEILPDLKDVIMARESNGITPGKLVIRPDSGDPVQVVCGMTVAPEDMYVTDMMNEYDVVEQDGKYFRFEVVDVCACECCGPDWELELGEEVPLHEVKGAIEVLWEIFGGTVTSKGYKLLDEHIGLIYGDSITTKRCLEILERLEAKGFASGNVTMGIGSYTYQMNSRDTFGFAVKATYTEVNGKGISIYKDPKTDSKKKSARGLLFVGRNSEAGYFLDDDVTPSEEAAEDNLLKLVFKDGRFVRTTTLEQIRLRLEGRA